jgi:26S proteasome regulatory subunit N11
MLLNLHKQNWSEGLRLRDYEVHKQDNEAAVQVRTLSI